jgi:RNA polymerase sigma-70 factor (ECF subfamily)
MNAESHEPADERLIESTLAGDDEAFAELVRRHKRKVFAIAARFARNEHELDDLCQEIFVKAYQKLGSYRAEAPFEHWVSRISVRACYDFLRKRRRDRLVVSLDDPQRPVREAAVEHDPGAGHAREMLARAMARLNPREQLVITLLELQERSVREVAALTGWSESNVKVRAFRARHALRKILEQDHER